MTSIENQPVKPVPFVDDLCMVCSKPRSNHPYRHAFVQLGSQPSLTEATQANPSPSGGDAKSSQVRINPPGDPVLRMALMRAGVISLAQLEAVEAELRGAGVAAFEAVGESGDR